MLNSILASASALLIATAASAQPSQSTQPSSTTLSGPSSGNLTFSTSQDWQTRAKSSTMRVAEYVLPGESTEQNAELIIYYFGGSGGSVDANVQRWLGQMQQPDGRPTSDVAKRSSRTIHGLNVSTLDVTGTYVAEVRPGATEKHNNPGFRMRTAVIETPRGPYYIKLVGPAKTVDKWNTEFERFLESLDIGR